VNLSLAVIILLLLRSPTLAPAVEKSLTGTARTEIPLVVRWDTYPFDILDVEKLFTHSAWNYFHTDSKGHVLMGYWEVEHGSESNRGADEMGSNDEAVLVLEGEIRVKSPGKPDQVARPGDVIMVLKHRKTTMVVDKPARAFFFCWNIDVEKNDEFIRKGGYYRGK